MREEEKAKQSLNTNEKQANIEIPNSAENNALPQSDHHEATKAEEPAQKDSISNQSQEITDKNDIYNSIWAPEESKEYKRETNKRPEKINITVWDIPNETRANQIRRYLGYYGKATVLSFMANGKNKAAFIAIEPRDERKKELLQSMWAIHLEKSKMSRLTQGRFDAEVLQERSKHKAIIRDVPKSAIETAFLRQIKGTKAKAVYISKNRNGNQRQMASIYFASEEDKQMEQTPSILLQYKTRLGGEEQRKTMRRNRHICFKKQYEEVSRKLYRKQRK